MPTDKSWRQISREVIDEAIRDNPGLAGKKLRAAVSKCYPFGERSMFPYKAWCAAMQERFGKTRPTPPTAKSEIKKREYEALMANQKGLF